MEEINKEEFLEIDAEQLQELMGGSEAEDKLPPIEIPMDWYETNDFHKGIHDYSYLAGAITALLNTGVSEGFVLDFLLNQETIKHNEHIAEVNKSMNVEMSKNQKAATEKYEL